jgi:hypothetical protein
MSNDIKKINVSLEEGDKGFLLTFPPPPETSVPILDRYIVSFDVASRLPLHPPAEIIFTPDSNNNPAQESYLKSSVKDSIQIGISIKSIHKAETQSLIRLNIKDIYNNILYTDYILVICSPNKVVKLNGSILSSLEKRGPNNGRVLRIRTDESVDAVSLLLTRMSVTGPGIPADQQVSIYGFIDGNRAEMELFPFDFVLSSNLSYDSAAGQYTFTQIVSCPTPADLAEIEFNNRFLVLDKDNNWTFSFRDRVIAQFIKYSGINDDNISILLNIKNFDALVGENSPVPIPGLVDIYGANRVVNDSICLSTI